MTRENTSRPSEPGRREPGTGQHAEALSARIGDIAWTALIVVAALWVVLGTVNAVRGTGSWATCAVAVLMLALGVGMRLRPGRRRARM